ncbi:hypothetical protein STEG23_030579, partial [Scotinomys teguina]
CVDSSEGGCPVHQDDVDSSEGGCPVHQDDVDSSEGGCPVHQDDLDSSEGGCPVHQDDVDSSEGGYCVPQDDVDSSEAHRAQSLLSMGAQTTHGSTGHFPEKKKKKGEEDLASYPTQHTFSSYARAVGIMKAPRATFSHSAGLILQLGYGTHQISTNFSRECIQCYSPYGLARVSKLCIWHVKVIKGRQGCVLFCLFWIRIKAPGGPEAGLSAYIKSTLPIRLNSGEPTTHRELSNSSEIKMVASDLLCFIPFVDTPSENGGSVA